MEATYDAAALPDATHARARTIALCVLLLAFFVDLLDTTIVNVAIPSLSRSLGASDSAIQWIVAGYTLSFALLLITGGRLGDIYGYKRVFMIGMAGFTLASTACGAASSVSALIAARIAQGACAALMVPQIMALVQVMYPSYEARRGISGYYAGVAGVATVSGPVLGALFIAEDTVGLGWRAIFLINVPIGLVALYLAQRHLPRARSPRPLRLDLLGVVLSVFGAALLMVPLIEGHAVHHGGVTWFAIPLGLAVFAVFAKTQAWKQRRDGSPLVVPRLFHARAFPAGSCVLLGFHAVVAGFLMTLAITLQTGLSYDVITAGLAGVPFSLGVSAGAALTGAVLLPRFGRTITSIGPLVMAAGIALLARELSAAASPLALAPALALSGLGMGFVVASIIPLVLTSVAIGDAGSASGVLNMASQLGSAFGVAIFGAQYFRHFAPQAPERVLAAFRGVVSWEIAALLAVAAVSLLLPARPEVPGSSGTM